MRPAVIDTNVLRVAEDVPGEWSADVVSAGVRYLLGVRDAGSVVLDDMWAILSEYAGEVASAAGRQPGVGYYFLLWLYQVRADRTRCETVAITPRSGSEGDYAQFPLDPELAGFHRKDRKFVAAAIASDRDPEIVNATDSDWWDYRLVLARHGVDVRFLCPQLFADRDGNP